MLPHPHPLPVPPALAPCQVSLIRSGRIDGDAMKHLVKQHQPTARIVEIDDVSRALPLLSQVRG